MIKDAFTLLLLACISCIADYPVSKFAEIQPAYDEITLRLVYSEHKPRDSDIKVFSNAIVKYGLAKKVYVSQRKVEYDREVWDVISLEVFRAFAGVSHKKNSRKKLYLDMYYLPGIYLHVNSKLVVGLANYHKSFISVFYGGINSKCIRYVMIHEILHIIGMDHCKNKKCIMYPSMSKGQRVLKPNCLKNLRGVIRRHNN